MKLCGVILLLLLLLGRNFAPQIKARYPRAGGRRHARELRQVARLSFFRALSLSLSCVTLFHCCSPREKRGNLPLCSSVRNRVKYRSPITCIRIRLIRLSSSVWKRLEKFVLILTEFRVRFLFLFFSPPLFHFCFFLSTIIVVFFPENTSLVYAS